MDYWLWNIELNNTDLNSEVSTFLQVTLAQEKLSEHAQTCRQQLIAKLERRESSHEGYMDMDKGTTLNKSKHQQQISDHYEECDPMNQNKQQNGDTNENNKYNCSQSQEEKMFAKNKQNYERFSIPNYSNEADDNMYINPSSPLANTPVISTRLSLPPTISPSNSNSERNSIVSLKRDSTDKNSDSSSITSSSTRCDESPEVYAMSASALRYAATKCGMLSRKERFLFVEHTKPYWVAALNQTLYMFYSDKDNKPVLQLDIADYKARAVATSGTAKTDCKFELVCPGKKTYQFSTDKQSDMEVWISALNAVAMDSSQAQLPTPPEFVDGGVTESEYKMPSSVPCPVPLRALTLQLEEHFKGRRLSLQNSNNTKRVMKEGRELPSLPHEVPTYDQPDPLVKTIPQLEYECLQEELYQCIPETQSQKTIESLRCLPQLPDQETYDCPEPTIRPVMPPPSPIEQEEFYCVIDNNNQDIKVKQPWVTIQEATYKNIDVVDAGMKTQEIVYKNIEEMNLKNIEDDTNYYNLVTFPEAETDQDSIYDVISEQRLMTSPLPTSHSQDKKTPTSEKPPVAYNIKGELNLNYAPKIRSPFVTNMATIFDKTLKKPNITIVKPPILNRSSH